MQRLWLFRYFNVVSSKVQGAVKVRTKIVKKVRNSNSTRILICNPAGELLPRPAGEERSRFLLRDAGLRVRQARLSVRSKSNIFVAAK